MTASFKFSERRFVFNGSLIAIHANLERDPPRSNARINDHKRCVDTSCQQAYPLVQTMPSDWAST